MNTPKKPREFWIIPIHPFLNEVSSEPHPSGIRVIEYSAYQALLSEAEKLADAIKSHHKLWTVGETNDYCVSECGQLCKALESWAKFKGGM